MDGITGDHPSPPHGFYGGKGLVGIIIQADGINAQVFVLVGESRMAQESGQMCAQGVFVADLVVRVAVGGVPVTVGVMGPVGVSNGVIKMGSNVQVGALVRVGEGWMVSVGVQVGGCWMIVAVGVGVW